MTTNSNFCVLNPLGQQAGSTDVSNRQSGFTSGNLKYTNISNETTIGTFGVTSGKWYYEVYVNSFNSDNGMIIGWVNDFTNLDTELGYNNVTHPSGAQQFGLYSQNQKLLYGPGDGGSSYNKTYGSGTPTDGDIIRIWLDADNGRFWAGLNGTIYGSGDPSAGTNWGFGTGGSPHNVAMTTRRLFPAIGNWSAADAEVTFNFGQDSSFQGAITAGTETDGNGRGNFKYSTEGFLALCSANLPVADAISPAETDDDYVGGKQFGIVQYTGNSTTGQSVTGLGFRPDVIWCKMTSSSQNNQLYHSGVLNSRSPTPTPFMFQMDTTSRFDDQSTGNTNPIISSFDSDGFTLGTSGSGPNDNARTYIAWCWRANATTTVSNSDGDRTSTIQVNSAAGFSTGTYTGNLSGAGTATVGHGLGKTPELIISMRSDGNSQRIYRHTGLDDQNMILQVESTGSQSTRSHNGSMSAPNATTFDTNYTDGLNTNGHTFVFMAWTSIPGFSAFGRYHGNSNSNGVYVHTGFRPKLVQLRRIDGSGSYLVSDALRRPFNDGTYREVYWNSTGAEATGADSHDGVDYFANGFRLKGTNAGCNGSGSEYIYSAWAESPFKFPNAF